jgi:hypothetical protein
MNISRKLINLIVVLLLFSSTLLTFCSDSDNGNGTIQDVNSDMIQFTWPNDPEKSTNPQPAINANIPTEAHVRNSKIFNNYQKQVAPLINQGLQLHMYDSTLGSQRGHRCRFDIDGRNVEKVIIEIKKIEAHSIKRGWITISTEPQKLDLLGLEDGTTAIVFNKHLEPGKYTHVRLILSNDNEVCVDGISHRLIVPGASFFGVQLINPFEINEGKIVKLTLDFDLKKSIKCFWGWFYVLNPIIKIQDVTEYDGAGIVTPSGGTITTADEQLNIEIPEGGTDNSFIISVDEIDTEKLVVHEVPNSNYVYKCIGNAYDLNPDDFTFNKDVKITFKYDRTKLSSENVSPNRIGLYRLDENTNTWTKVSATVSIVDNTITAWVSHFSIYAPFEERDWDWTLNQNYPLVMFYNNQLAVIQEENNLPYYSGYGPAYNDLGTSTDRMDIWQKDGWALVAKDFGHVDGLGNPLRAPRSYPFFMLYNRARGVLRLFYYYPQVEQPFTMAKLTLSHLTGKSSYMTFENSKFQSLDNYDDVSNKSMCVIAELQRGAWNYADFILAGYDPNIGNNDVDHLDANFRILIEGAELSSGTIGLIGKISLKQMLGESSIRTQGFGDTIGAGKEAWGYYKNADNAADWLAESMGWGAFSGPAIPAMIGAAGFVKSLIGSRNSHSTPLNLEGDIVLNGDIKFETLYNIGDIVMGIPGSPRSAGDNVMYGSIFDHPLGLFILKNKLIIYGRPKIMNAWCLPGDPPYSGAYIQVEIGLANKIEFEINSNINLEMNGYKYKITSTEASFVWEDKELNKQNPPNFIDLNQFNSKYNFATGTLLNINRDVAGVVQECGTWCAWYFRGDYNCNIIANMEDKMKFFPAIAIKVTIDRDPPVGDFVPVVLMKTYKVKYQNQ